MGNGIKKNTFILYKYNALAAVFASVFPAVKSVDIQRWVLT